MGTTISGNLHMAVCQNLVPLVNIKIAGKWMFIPLKMVLIGIDPYPYDLIMLSSIFLQVGSRHPLPGRPRSLAHRLGAAKRGSREAPTEEMSMGWV